MKKIILSALLFGALQATAQDNTGSITYEEVISLDIKLEGDMEAFAAMIPKEKKSKKLLTFNPEASVYTVIKEEEKKQDINGNGMHITFNTDQPDEIIYKDIAGGKMYQQRSFMDRDFLVTGAIKKYDWKITGNQKKLLGYPCQEATTITDKDTITAWFTPAIPVASGPASMGSLPGMILEAQINKQVHITAIEVNKGKVDEELLKKPKKGKKVTSEEFEAIVKEKTKEMQEQYGGSGNKVFMMKVTETR